MKFKYIGDNESPQKTTVLGIEFPKGEAVDVDEDHKVNGKHAVTLLQGMSHFEAVSDEAPKTATEDGKKAPKTATKKAAA